MPQRNAGLSIFALALLALIPTMLFGWVTEPAADQEVDQCVKCHTSSRTLIKIVREIRKNCPEPAKSTESSGEG